MKADEVHPQLREAVAAAPRLPYHRLDRLPAMRRAAAMLGRTEPVEGVKIENVDDGRVRVRTYAAPDGHGGGLVWVHGGGLLLGTPEQDDAWCSGLVRGLGLVVVSVRYRFAPEFPFPAAADDCHGAWAWVQAHAPQLGVEPLRVALGGASAGAGLAGALAQRVRDEQGPQPCAVVLREPMLDDRTAARTELDAREHPVWNNRANRAAWGAYLGAEVGADQVPAYSVPARCADLRGLPPTWLGVGSLDLFADEAEAYAHRLRRAGVACVLERVPGAVHNFVRLAPDSRLAGDFLAREAAFVQRYTGLR